MVINQFHAHGDILFIEPICRHIWETTGSKPILPVRDHLMWFAEYIDSAHFVPMSKFTLDYESMAIDNPDYLPLRFANQIVRKLPSDYHNDWANTMPDKYILANIPLEKWLTMNINFKVAKGLALMKELGLTPESDFVLINKNSQAGRIVINVKHENVIQMREIPGFTLLDWFFVVLHAKENHHVSTSTFYMMQAIANKFDFKSRVFLYPRPNEDGLQGISKLKPSFKVTLCE